VKAAAPSTLASRHSPHDNGKCPQVLKREAAAAWRRFVSCVQALPPDQATLSWQAVAAEAAAKGLAIGEAP